MNHQPFPLRASMLKMLACHSASFPNLQLSLLIFHPQPPQAPVFIGLHVLSMWSSCIGYVELFSLIHFARRHYFYPYIPPTEWSQLRNLKWQELIVDQKKTKKNTYNQILNVFKWVLLLHTQFFLKHKWQTKEIFETFSLFSGQLGQHCLAVT